MSNEQRLNRANLTRRTSHDQPTDQQFVNRHGYSRRYAILPHFATETVLVNEDCGGCQEVVEDLTTFEHAGITLASHYQITPFCDGDLVVTFEHTSGGAYVGTDGGATITCNGGATTLNFSMQVNGDAPGEVVITMTDGSDTFTVVNDACFDGEVTFPMVRTGGPKFCPCGKLKSYLCLVPIPDPGA